MIGDDGTPLSGDMAARILDWLGLCSTVTPYQETKLHLTPVVFAMVLLDDQRGMGEKEMIEVADIMADLLLTAKPYSIETRQGPHPEQRLIFRYLKMQK